LLVQSRENEGFDDNHAKTVKARAHRCRSGADSEFRVPVAKHVQIQHHSVRQGSRTVGSAAARCEPGGFVRAHSRAPRRRMRREAKSHSHMTRGRWWRGPFFPFAEGYCRIEAGGLATARIQHGDRSIREMKSSRRVVGGPPTKRDPPMGHPVGLSGIEVSADFPHKSRHTRGKRVSSNRRCYWIIRLRG